MSLEALLFFFRVLVRRLGFVQLACLPPSEGFVKVYTSSLKQCRRTIICEACFFLDLFGVKP